jgi:hypothetical protein
MRIAYATTDDVNRALAAQLAMAFGAVVKGIPPGSAPGDGRFDAVVYDLDSVPPDGRAALLEQILSGRWRCPMAVHGYSLSEGQAAALRLRGVAVGQRLDRELIRTLCVAALRAFTTVPPDDALSDLTWVNIVE